MNPLRLIIFISGNGSNLQAIIDAIESRILHATIMLVVSNKEHIKGLERAKKHNIPTKTIIRSNLTRENYDSLLNKELKLYDADLYILAGWMHIFTKTFLINLNNPIINLHPALPGEFPGKTAIKDAFSSFQLGKIEYTGIMIHHVVEKIDAGDVLCSVKIPIYKQDKFDDWDLVVHNVFKDLKKIIDTKNHYL